MDPTNLVEFTSQKLKACTNNFNQHNLIGLTQFGRLFRGNFEGQHVLVKIWENEKLEEISSKHGDEYLIIKEEMKFWTNPTLKGYPNLVMRIIGYCWEKDVKGVVYDLNPIDTLHNVIIKDGLNWLQRINVIYELAKFMKFIHDQEKQTLVFNISANHILLDKDYKPKLFDLLLLSEVKMMKEQLTMSTNYIDPYFSMRGGDWDRSCEVFSFGLVLLELITQRNSDTKSRENTNINYDNLVHIWAKNEYRPNCSLVHKNLQQDWHYNSEDGVAITQLAMQCIEFFPSNRPSISGVLQSLENLSVLQRLGDARPTKKERRISIYHDTN